MTEAKKPKVFKLRTHIMVTVTTTAIAKTLAEAKEWASAHPFDWEINRENLFTHSSNWAQIQEKKTEQGGG